MSGDSGLVWLGLKCTFSFVSFFFRLGIRLGMFDNPLGLGAGVDFNGLGFIVCFFFFLDGTLDL